MCLTLIKGIFPEHLKYTCMQILWMLHGYPVFDCSPIFSNALHVLSFSRTSVTFTSISSGGMVVLFRNAKSCFKKDENSIKPLQCTWWCVNCIICHTNNNVELQKDSSPNSWFKKSNHYYSQDNKLLLNICCCYNLLNNKAGYGLTHIPALMPTLPD